MLIIGTLVLMVAYLALAGGLAIQYDRQFLLNDAIALAVFTVLLVGLFIIERPLRRR